MTIGEMILDAVKKTVKSIEVNENVNINYRIAQSEIIRNLMEALINYRNYSKDVYQSQKLKGRKNDN